MPVTIKIDVQDSATAAVIALEQALGARTYGKAVARVAANLYTRNFERLAQARHRGGPHNYYLTAARSTMGRVGSDGVPTVTIYAPAGIALRRYGSAKLPGGVLRASGRVSSVTGKPVTKLAIPDEGGPADGRVPLDFKTSGIKLRLAVFKTLNRAALVRDDDASDKPVVYFWLHESVIQPEDASVFPSDAKLSQDINRTLDRWASGVWAQYIRKANK